MSAVWSVIVNLSPRAIHSDLQMAFDDVAHEFQSVSPFEFGPGVIAVTAAIVWLIRTVHNQRGA